MVLRITFCFISILISMDMCKGQTLTESESVVIKPGNNHKLTCTFSGIEVDNADISWIRQAEGKGLEWISHISAPSGGSKYYSKTVEGRFTISRDNSKMQVYLHMTNLQAEETGIYYCARKMVGGGYFDYWGKGTKVTVSSDPKPPDAVFTISQCDSSSNSLIIGCLASGFSPDSLELKLKNQNKNDLTGFMQYPTVTTGGKTFKFGVMNITKEEMDQNKITCVAEHQQGTVKETFRKVSPQTPTVSLVPVITEKSTFALCVIENFFPKNLTVQWKVKDKHSQSGTQLQYKRNAEGLYTAHSLYKVSSDIWNTSADYTCEATYQGTLIPVTKNFKAKLTLTLKPPFMKKIFVENAVVLEAVVSGDVNEAVENNAMKCTNVLKISDGRAEFSNDISQHTKKYNLTINTNKWFDGEMVTCTIRDTNNNIDIKQEIRFNKGDGQTPSVFIYRPDNTTTDHVSLVCAVTSPNLGDVYLMWKVSGDKEPYIEGRTSAPINREDSTSVLSVLTVSKQQYDNTITCAVKHANVKNINSPLLVSTSSSEPPEPEKGFALNCNKDVLEEDEFRSLWSTATSFIFLFLFSLTYSAVLSFFKMKQ